MTSNRYHYDFIERTGSAKGEAMNNINPSKSFVLVIGNIDNAQSFFKREADGLTGSAFFMQ